MTCNNHFLGKKLKDNLDTIARERSGGMDGILAGKNINVGIAPLQLAPNQDFEELDANTFFHRRKDVAERFSKPPKGDIHISDLFTQAEAYAKQAATSVPDTAKQHHILIHGNIVWMVGQAGIGKSTLAKVIVKEILDPQKRLFDASYVFFVNFRDVDYENETNLLELLCTKSTVFKNMNMSKNELHYVLSVLDDSDDVVILMDGLDEANLSKQPCGICSPYDTAKAEIFLINLFHGNIFKKSKKIVTSRPLSLRDVKSKNYRPTFVVKVLGLNEDAQEQMCKDIYADDEARSAQVYRLVCGRPDLKSYCYIPAVCIWVMISFKRKDLSKSRTEYSLTGIIVAALEWFIETLEIDGKTFQIKELSHLAFHGFENLRLFFERRHIVASRVNLENSTTFFTVLKLLEGSYDTKIYFSHYMLQEFFTAVWMVMFMKFEDFLSFSTKFDQPRFQMVLQFMFGLSNQSLQNQVLNYAAETCNTLSDRKSIKEWLKKFACNHIHRRDEKIRGLFSCPFRIFHWVQEMRDNQFTKQVTDELNTEIHIASEILPSDLSALHYVIRKRESDLNFYIQRPSFAGGCGVQFFEEFCVTLQKRPNIKVNFS